MIHTVIANKNSGSFDIIRPPSMEDPRGYYLALRAKLEAEMYCSLLNRDLQSAEEFCNQFFLARHLLEYKDT